jgi:5-formyltetrahydrofolate cyclo-ligase
MEASAEKHAKAELRRRMSVLRDALPAEERARRSEKLCRDVAQEVLHPLRKRLGRPLTIGVYAAFRSEADPLPLARICWTEGDTVAAPRIVGDALEWRVVTQPSDWKPGSWGIPEPDAARTQALPEDRVPDAVLVPGLAFHPDGGRLGYGGGYYDRTYAAASTRGHDTILWIGFALALQMAGQPLPREPHDLPLDILATDLQLIWLEKEGE